MVVKRQKSNTDINGKDLAVTGGGKGANGALITAVSLSHISRDYTHSSFFPQNVC